MGAERALETRSLDAGLIAILGGGGEREGGALEEGQVRRTVTRASAPCIYTLYVGLYK